MNREEFSDQFDILLNSYNGSAHTDIRLDEYEKSLFLTDSQEAEVLSLYTGKNLNGESFEETEQLRRYLAPLIAEKELVSTAKGSIVGVKEDSKIFTLPSDLWFITYEAVNLEKDACDNLSPMEVYPTKQDEYHKIKKNPFRGANDRRALRLDLSGGNVEIICKYTIDKYYVRYLRKLNPIILVPLPDNLSIRGESQPMDCELHEAFHQRILERAVAMAIRAKMPVQPTTENK